MTTPTAPAPAATTLLGKSEAAPAAAATPPADAPVVDAAQTTAAPDATKTAETKTDATRPAEVADIEVKFGEGVKVDEVSVNTFKALSKELGLDSPKAQKLADLYTGLHKQAVESAVKSFNDRLSGWETAVKADKDLGGENLPKSLELARRAVDKFGGRDVLEALESSGLGSHPAVLKMLVAVGKGIAEDRIAGAAGNGAPKDPNAHLKQIYKNSPQMFSKE